MSEFRSFLSSLRSPFWIFSCFCISVYLVILVGVWGILGLFHGYSDEYKEFFMPQDGRDSRFSTEFKAEGLWSWVKEIYQLTLSLDENLSSAALFERGIIFCSGLAGMVLVLIFIEAVRKRFSSNFFRLESENDEEWYYKNFKEKCFAAFMFPIRLAALYLFFTPAYFFGFFGLLLFWGSLALYLLPTMLSNKHHNSSAITILNILLGWTVIGWIIAFVWAMTKPQNVSDSG